MSAAGRFFWTPHAVRRAVDRLWSGLDYEAALVRLVKAGETAHFVRRQGNGDLWRAARPDRFRFIVGEQDDRGLPPVLTVIAPHDGHRPC